MLAPNAFVQNRYLFVRRLGGGERSAVYEAIDMTTRSNVALKQVIVGADAADVRREGFEQEAQRLFGLHHPALPALRGVFTEGDSLFLATEFVPGDDLMAELQRNRHPFPLVQVLRWADNLLDALDYLHSQVPPILHRDISPRNLKLTPRGQVMLIDIGLAQSESLPAQVKPAGAGQVSPFQFMPPEQVARTGTTIRSDLFALAATLYYLLTGTLPALAGKRANAIGRGQPDPLLPARDINPDLPLAVSDLLTRALALDPSARPSSAADMRVALDQARVAPHELLGARAAQLAPTISSPTPAARPVDAPTLPIPLPHTASPVAVVLSPPGAPRRWLLPVIGVAVLVVLVLTFLLLRGLGTATDATTVSNPTSVPPVPTIAPRLATSTLFQPTAAPTEQPETVAQPATAAPIEVPAQVTHLDPASVFAGALPIMITVDGSNLDKVRVARFVSGSGAVIPAQMQTRVPSQLMLSIRALPEPITGEVNYVLQLDGIVQKASVITLRDYHERKPTLGVLADYSYTSRVAADETGAYAGLLAEAVPNSSAQGKLRNGDQVDVLRNDLADWYQVRIASSADPSQAGLIGWVERWLIDNQNPPPVPTPTPEPTVAVQVFVGRVYSAPTDAAVQCGTNFESSIYGSIENSAGKGIAGAVVRVTSADGRNSYTLTTGRGGVYNFGGLGCTTWNVRLISIPNTKIQANTVKVTNLNGGRFTSAEVRFKLRT
jgi:eukaryotic-like serine/threonine-protein kinase